ncbi:MAG: hypothetical protein XD37_1962, partial [Thermoanaerobacter thermocopriae]
DLSSPAAVLIISSKKDIFILCWCCICGMGVYEVILKAGDKVVKIKEPFKISFNLPDKNDFKKVGVYFWEEKNGRWEHIGGKADSKANTITVEAKQMTIYTVFEHEKNLYHN